MNDAVFQQRELTLMFTDIVGYSRLMGRDQAQTIGMLEDYRRILLEQIDNQQGTVIEFIGDAVFARFETPQAAVTAAVEIQKALFAFNHFRDKSLPRLQTRIGLHCGEVATKGEAVFGDDVNIAARLEPIAVADGICVSQSVYDAVKEELREPVLKLGVQPLKNIESKVKAFLIRPLGITFKTRVHYFNRKLNQKLGAYRYPIAAAVALVIISLFYWVPRWLVPGYDANYVEISDFQNLMNSGGEVDYLSAGITEAVRSQLADVRDVYLVKSGEGILAPIMLEGSVQKVGDNLRIAYQLIRRKGNIQIAGGKLDGAYQDIFILQDRVVAEIAKYLAEEFKLPNFRPAKVDMTSDVLAYDYYMRGLEWLRKPASVEANMDEAIKYFSTALVHDKNFMLANVGICEAYGIKYDLTKVESWILHADKYCDHAYAMNSNSSQVLKALASVYRMTGRLEESRRLIEKSINMDPNNIDAILTMSWILRLSNELEEAKKYANNAIAMDSKDWRGYHELAKTYILQSDYENAIKTNDKILEITPQNVSALNNLGAAYFYSFQFKKAAKSFENVVEIQPTALGYSNTGTMYYYARDFEDSIKVYKEAARLKPDDYRFPLHIADAYRHLYQIDISRKFYGLSRELASKSIKVNNKDAQTHIYLSLAYCYLSEKENSLFHINRAMEIAPTDPDVKLIQLQVLLNYGESELAASVLKDLIGSGYSSDLIEVNPDLKKIDEAGGVEAFLILAKSSE